MISRTTNLLLAVFMLGVGTTVQGQSNKAPARPKLVRNKRHQSSRVNGVQKTRRQKKQVEAARWYTFRGPDDDFTLDFPEEPQRDEDTQGIIAVARRYSYEDAAVWLTISFEDLGLPPKSREANEITRNHGQMLASRVRQRGGKIIRIRWLAKDTSEIEVWMPSGGVNWHSVLHTVRRNSRLYLLGCASQAAGREVDKDSCRRFFSSFRVIGVPR